MHECIKTLKENYTSHGLESRYSFRCAGSSLLLVVASSSNWSSDASFAESSLSTFQRLVQLLLRHVESLAGTGLILEP